MAIDDLMRRLHARFGSDICDWARVMVSARSARLAGLPAVAHDRLRAAAEFRALMSSGR